MYKNETYRRLETIRQSLLNATKECRADMHEPDEQGVGAVVTGFVLDNAQGSPLEDWELERMARGYEFKVGITQYGDIVTWINLADLIALARMGDPLSRVVEEEDGD